MKFELEKTGDNTWNVKVDGEVTETVVEKLNINPILDGVDEFTSTVNDATKTMKELGETITVIMTRWQRFVNWLLRLFRGRVKKVKIVKTEWDDEFFG